MSNKFQVRKLISVDRYALFVTSVPPRILSACAFANIDARKSHGRAKWLSNIEAYVRLIRAAEKYRKTVWFCTEHVRLVSYNRLMAYSIME